MITIDWRTLIVAGTRHGHYNHFNLFMHPLMITIDWRTLIVAGTRHGHYNRFNFFMHPLMIAIDWRTLIVACTGTANAWMCVCLVEQGA